MYKRFRITVISTLLLLGACAPALAGETYGARITHKLGVGLSNLTLCWLEFPKNMINTTNQTNLALGLGGGMVKGLLHTLGRVGSGLVDTITFAYPTRPIPDPELVWQRFSSETQYGAVMQPAGQ